MSNIKIAELCYSYVLAMWKVEACDARDWAQFWTLIYIEIKYDAAKVTTRKPLEDTTASGKRGDITTI